MIKNEAAAVLRQLSSNALLTNGKTLFNRGRVEFETSSVFC
jgi:hypothetical protein